MNFIAIYCIVNIKRAVHFFSRHTTQKCWLTCSRFGSRQYYSAYPPHNISKHFKRYICTQFLRTFTLHGTRVVISVPLSTKKSSTASRDSTYRAFNHGSSHYVPSASHSIMVSKSRWGPLSFNMGSKATLIILLKAICSKLFSGINTQTIPDVSNYHYQLHLYRGRQAHEGRP